VIPHGVIGRGLVSTSIDLVGAGLRPIGLRRLPFLLPVVLLALLLGAAGAFAQGRPLRARPVQPLNFGDLLGGLPTTVLRTDPINSGQFDIRGERLTEVLVDLLLPSALVGPGGATVPLTFGPGTAGYSPDGSIGSQVAFDPAVPQAVRLPGNGRGAVFLGGTASPPGQVAVGAYSATITITISYIGN